MRFKSLFEQAKEELGYEATGLLCSTTIGQYDIEYEDIASVSEWLSREKARRLGADFIYFRRYGDRPSQPLIYIYDFSSRLTPPDDLALGALQKDIWSSQEVPCVFVFTKDSVQIINTSKVPDQTLGGYLPVFLIAQAHEINEEIRKRFAAYRLDSGEFWQEEEKNFAFENSAHKTLLSKLRKVRENFIEADVLPTVDLVNRLLIQCVLIRFLEEKEDVDESGNTRKVFPDGFFQQVAQASSFQEALEKGTFLQVFDYLNDPQHLNGKIFEWTDEEKELLRAVPSSRLISLLYDTHTSADGQGAFWDLYSFRFLPVEVISSIYEALFTTSRNVKEDGMVYTPPHLAAFLVDEAMPLTAWQNQSEFKVLDPACGSGIFLVLAFKRLVHWWRLAHQGEVPTADALTTILQKSIYGVDNNESAVLLTRFSLCLALCDMLTPPEIWSSLHFPALDKQLVSVDFFKWEGLRYRASFDLVIGNPPFVQAHGNLPDWKTLSEEKIPQKQIALYFLCAGMNLVKEKGLLCLVLKSSSLLYTTTGNDFRKWFFANNKVHQIIDFTLLARNHVLWSSQEPDTLALFASNERPDTTKNILHLVVRRTHATALKRYFEIDAYDFHWVSYTAALQDDFVWKCNLLGGGRLYGLIKSLKAYPTLLNFVDKNEGWVCSVGYRTSENPNDPECPEITGKPTLPTEWLTEDGIRSFEFKNETSRYFFRKRDTRIYESPHLLIKLNIGDKHSIPTWYFANFDIGFKEKIFSIHAPEKEASVLGKVFDKIKRYNDLYRAFLFSTSPECLIHMNTVLQSADIKSLPFPHIIDSEIQINNTEKILVGDVLAHYQEFIRQPETTKTLHPIPSKNLPGRLAHFGPIFCKNLNTVYQNGNYRFRMAEAGSFHFNNFIFIAFRYDDQPELPLTEPRTNLHDISAEELSHLLTLDKGHVQFKRILKIYRKDYVCFIKPNQLRYWLDSIALRDADWVISDLAKQGF